MVRAARSRRPIDSVTEARKPSVHATFRKPSTKGRQVVKPISNRPPRMSRSHAMKRGLAPPPPPRYSGAMAERAGKTIGNKVAPTRFILFIVAATVATAALALSGKVDPRQALMLGFDAGALLFLVACLTLLVPTHPESMRAHSEANDASGTLLLLIPGAVRPPLVIGVATQVAGRREE